MSITRSESNFYKKNGYLLKDELVSMNDINKLNALINKIVTKEKNIAKFVPTTHANPTNTPLIHVVINSFWRSPRNFFFLRRLF